MKRIISILLTLCLLLGNFAPAVYAQEPQSDASVQTDDITIEGTNGFGNLLSAEIVEAQEEQAESYEGGYTITDLVIEGNTATVTYDALGEANLVVALYTEDGIQLLTSANTDSLSVIGKADGITLGVLQGDQGYDQVDLGILRQFLIFSNDVAEQCLIDLEIIASLVESDTKDFLDFLFLRHIIGINSYHIVAALALALQNLKSLFGIAGSNHTIGNLGGDQRSGQLIADIA